MEPTHEVSSVVSVLDQPEIKISVTAESKQEGPSVTQMTEKEKFLKEWAWLSELQNSLQALDKIRPKDVDPLSKLSILNWLSSHTSDENDLYENCAKYIVQQLTLSCDQIKKIYQTVHSQRRVIKSNTPQKVAAKLKKAKKQQEEKEDDTDWEDNTDSTAIQHKKDKAALKRKREISDDDDVKEPVVKKQKIDPEELAKFEKALEKEKEKGSKLPKLQCPFIMSTQRANYKKPFNFIILEFGLNKQEKTLQRTISEKRQRQSKPLYQKVTSCAFIGDHVPSFLKPEVINELGISTKDRLTLLTYWSSELTGIIPPNQRFKTESSGNNHNFVGPGAFTLITSKSSCNMNRGCYISYPNEHAGLIVAQSKSTEGKIDWDLYKRTSEKRVKLAAKVDIAKAKKLIEKYSLQKDFLKDCERTPLERVYCPITPAEQRGAGAPGEKDEMGRGTWVDETATTPRQYLSRTKALRITGQHNKNLAMPKLNLAFQSNKISLVPKTETKSVLSMAPTMAHGSLMSQPSSLMSQPPSLMMQSSPQVPQIMAQAPAFALTGAPIPPSMSQLSQLSGPQPQIAFPFTSSLLQSPAPQFPFPSPMSFVSGTT